MFWTSFWGISYNSIRQGLLTNMPKHSHQIEEALADQNPYLEYQLYRS